MTGVQTCALPISDYAVGRPGLPGRWPADYHDTTTPGTPAWASELTGVPGPATIRVARDFAANAIESRGRSQIVMGAAAVLQILMYFAATRLIPQASEELAGNNVAVGTLFGSVFIAIGLLNAACLS